MPINIRLTEREQEDLRKKAIEINKLLVKEGHEPLRDSEIIHEILNITLNIATVNKRGQISIEGLLKD